MTGGFRPSTALFLASLAIGLAGTVAIWWFFARGMTLVGWLVLPPIIAAAIYGPMMKAIATQRIVDRDHDPDRPQR